MERLLDHHHGNLLLFLRMFMLLLIMIIKKIKLLMVMNLEIIPLIILINFHSLIHMKLQNLKILGIPLFLLMDVDRNALLEVDHIVGPGFSTTISDFKLNPLTYADLNKIIHPELEVMYQYTKEVLFGEVCYMKYFGILLKIIHLMMNILKFIKKMMII